MENIYTSAAQLIGHTPLLELTHLEKKYDLKARLLAKLEYFNPAGSVKDRVAPSLSSSSPPPAIPASAWPRWPPPGAIVSSLSCRIA